MSVLLQYLLVATVGLGVLAALAVAFLLPLLRRVTTDDPQRRARTARLLLALPLVGAPLAALAGLAPSLLDSTVAHCVTHGVDHVHLCLVHAPSAAPPTALVVGAGLLALVPLVRAGRTLWRELRAAALAQRALQGRGAAMLPMAATVGFWRPRVLIGDALAASLTPLQRRVVQAHEQAHARRRDPLRTLLARLAGAWHLPGTARTLQAELATRAELHCDRAAADAVGDRFAVATTLVRVARLGRAEGCATDMGAAVASMLGASLETRVRALVDPPPPARRPWGVFACGALVAVAVLTGTWHHALEHALDLVRHGVC